MNRSSRIFKLCALSVVFPGFQPCGSVAVFGLGKKNTALPDPEIETQQSLLLGISVLKFRCAFRLSCAQPRAFAPSLY